MYQRLTEIDQNIFLALNFDGGPFWDTFFWTVTGKLTWVPLYLFIIWLIYRRMGWKNTLIAVAGIALMVVATDHICNFFKDNLSRFRPTYTPSLEGMVHTVRNYMGAPYGTVSAHAAICFSMTVCSAGLIRSRIFTACMVLWALLVCYSRIYVGLHFPLDLFYGMVTGIVTGWLTLLLIRSVIKKVAARNGKAAG